MLSESQKLGTWLPRPRVSGTQRSFSPKMERKDPFGISTTLKVSVTLKIKKSAGGAYAAFKVMMCHGSGAA
jgi:hypothetical protein